MSVMYEVDQAPLRDLEADNFHHPVFTCLNPKGEIAPGMSANMEWIFSPLESKTYSVRKFIFLSAFIYCPINSIVC